MKKDNQPKKSALTQPEKEKKLEFTGGAEKFVTSGELEEKIQIAITDAISRIKDSLTSNFVTILAIFASFITFLGIEIQILKNICDYWRLIGFSSFILLAIIVFVFFIYFFADNLNKKNWLKTFGMLVLICMLLSFTLYSFSKAGDEYICKITQLNDRFGELDAQYSKQNNSQIDKINNRLGNIEKIISK